VAIVLAFLKSDVGTADPLSSLKLSPGSYPSRHGVGYIRVANAHALPIFGKSIQWAVGGVARLLEPEGSCNRLSSGIACIEEQKN
jgi:hypothetical protein